MKYHKLIVLKNSKECLLHYSAQDDAAALLRHMMQTSEETGFIARYPEDTHLTEEQERNYLTQLR